MVRATAVGCVAMLVPAALAQTSELYINQYDARGMVVVQGGSVVRSWDTNNAGETALAVAGTIRTAGNYWTGGGTGAEYDLNGIWLGETYTIVAGGNWFDGATDGVSHNYAVQHNGDYNLYQFDRDWSNPEVLFAVGFATSGIAYDDGTFWVTDSLSRLVRHLDATGELISSFSALESSYAYGIALDPVDGTLWLGGFGSNLIYQYNQDGEFLDVVAVPGIGSAFGMEFAVSGGDDDCDDDGIPDDQEDDCNDDGEVDDCDPLHCPADLAEPHPTLNVFDFLAFQTAFGDQNSCADLVEPFGVFNVFDFLAFQTSFGNGCPT